ncbi:unnamed protein product [Ilex paraguariensis]|uniref:Homeobox-leucine zipper protein n=1 Tax=Ilex paraguariensis TaxID=185542 RepID=A0ABC8UYU5_9AQUA
MAFVSAESMFQTHEDNYFPTHSPNLLPSSYAPQDFHGVSPLIMRRSMSFSGVDRCNEVRVDDDMSDDGSALGEKKRRLNLEQVKALEKSFELGNKLEPERKMQLAKALGLQPRQVAIWFQNRRARWKTKQLERDYDVLKRQLEALKADNDSLKTQNKKLHAELLALKCRESTGTGPINLNKDTDGSWSNGSENSCDVNKGTTRTPSTVGPQSLAQALQSSSSRQGLQYQKIHQTAPDESLCNMFNGIEEQTSFWPWSEQQHFH